MILKLKKKIKKNSKQVLIRNADKLWKEKAVKVWGKKCIICSSPAIYHHYIPKSKSVLLRYDIQNAIPLCKKRNYDQTT